MNYFISGGCKNGKSMYAQQISKTISNEKRANLYYVATMIPKDDEDLKRIQRHLKEREGWGFETLEIERNLSDYFGALDSRGIYLFDSVTAFLENNMFDKDYNIDNTAADRCIDQLYKFMDLVGGVVLVSDYIYSDSIKYEESTELYKKALAKVDKALASRCDKVLEVVYGNILEFK